jgi:FKBP-type peptidyl-prolyl cis-trans isomerase
MNKIFIFSVFTLFSLTSCLNSDERQEKEDRDAYLTANNITVEPTKSGLYYIETLAGTGDLTVAEDTVFVNYTGTFLDGTIFGTTDESGKPLEFIIGTGMVIDGWDEGILYMKKGGKATLIVPSELAYGFAGFSPIIPGYTTLVFDVELVDIKRH